ncbi:SDR family oxidoreductase [candidate division WWE3 bacterium]|nr:SDR family oxidoreductase [candidate division WWE3 bacterium]
MEKQSRQTPPGIQENMKDKPESIKKDYKAAGKLKDKTAIITGGDSGIGRAAAIMFAQEGANVSIVYLNENNDAQETKQMIEELGRHCLTINGDVGQEDFCEYALEQILHEYKHVDVLINNAAEQHPQEKMEDITQEQLEKTFRTNVFGYFYMAKSTIPHLSKGSSIINTSSVTAYRGSSHLIDYSATKGAIVAFTRSLSQNLAAKEIRVNAVAPGPVWTPLITSTFPQEKIESFGSDTALQRAAQPTEIAPCFVFLASEDSSYMTGQVLHPNGGEIING